MTSRPTHKELKADTVLNYLKTKKQQQVRFMANKHSFTSHDKTGRRKSFFSQPFVIIAHGHGTIYT